MRTKESPTTSDTPTRKHLSPYLAPLAAFGIMIVPIVVAGVLIVATGANLLDGLFGIYRNTPFQRAVIEMSGWLILSAPILSLIFCIVFARTRKDLSWGQRFAPLIVIVSIVLLVVLYLFNPLSGITFV